MRLPTVLIRALVLRGISVWFFARLMAIALLSSAGVAGGGVVLPVWTLTVSASLVHLDLHRRKELMLLNNIGVATGNAVIIGSLPALLFEAVLLAA